MTPAEKRKHTIIERYGGFRVIGLKAAKTNKERYGDSFYQRAGSLGGMAPTRTPKGFAANRKLAAEAGRKGGAVSRRRKPENEEE